MTCRGGAARKGRRGSGRPRARGGTRRDIALQFLAEAVTLTGVGGGLGIVGGLAAALLAQLLFKFHAAAPLWSIALGFGVSSAVVVGLRPRPAVHPAPPRSARAPRTQM